jgi:hypothetical protein
VFGEVVALGGVVHASGFVDPFPWTLDARRTVTGCPLSSRASSAATLLVTPPVSETMAFIRNRISEA